MDYQYILVDVKDRIATVTINRPEYSNAFARESYFEIADAMNTLGAREDVGAIVITGAGKHFSAGGDIKRFKMLVDTGAYLKAEDIEAVSAMPMSIRSCQKPVIAMINGVATGAGLSCALAYDFRIVEPSSKMIMAFVNMGLCGDNESIYTLMRLVGPDKAELMMMTGDAYKGEFSRRWKAGRDHLCTGCKTGIQIIHSPRWPETPDPQIFLRRHGKLCKR